jgi:hypothetical protein
MTLVNKIRNFVNKSPADRRKAIRATLAERTLQKIGGDRGIAVQSSIYAAYRPDSDAIHGAHAEIETIAAKWRNIGDLPRLYAMIFNVKQIIADGVPGDFAELGVHRGGSAAALAHFARLHDRKAYLFDTFEGFDQRDLKGGDAAKGMVDFSDTSLEFVTSVVGTENVEFVKGYFPASVTPAISAAQFAMVHLDCDLYEPTKAALTFFYPRLSPGGLLIMHDYSSLWWEGIKRAVDEFVLTVHERLVLMPDKCGTAMLRKSL